MSQIPISDDLCVSVSDPKIVRTGFVSLTIDGERYSADAVFNLKDIPQEAHGLMVQVICQMQGYDMFVREPTALVVG